MHWIKKRSENKILGLLVLGACCLEDMVTVFKPAKASKEGKDYLVATQE